MSLSFLTNHNLIVVLTKGWNILNRQLCLFDHSASKTASSSVLVGLSDDLRLFRGMSF